MIGYDSPRNNTPGTYARTVTEGHHRSYYSNRFLFQPLTSTLDQKKLARTYHSYRVNTNRVRRWIRECNECHKKTCPHDSPLCAQSGLSTLEHIYLIDLEKDYQGEFKDFTRPGALSSGKFHLPNTIRDAISLARRLGERQIWVDSLCIIQDEGPEKQRYINALASIFANTYFTIVAAEGEDANHGIRGTGFDSQDRYVPCKILEFPLGPLMVQEFHDITAYPILSKWASRGWTLQEATFPRRLLIMDKLVSWICRGGRAMEEFKENWDSTAIETRECGLNNNMPAGPDLSVWAELANSFNDRSLTYETDTLNAFAGITSIASRSFPGGIFHGLPVIFFELGLLWQPSELLRRRQVSDDQGVPIPLLSWSWVGWAEHLDLDLWFYSEWNPKSSDERLKIFPFVKWHSRFNKVTCRTGTQECSINNALKLDPNYNDPNDACGLESRPTTQKDVNIIDGIFLNPVVFAEQGFDPSLRNDPSLHFQTVGTSLRIGKIIPNNSDDRPRPTSTVAEFVGGAGRSIGAMIPNVYEPDEFSHAQSCQLIAISWGKIRHNQSESDPILFLDFADWAVRDWYQNINVEPSETDWFEFYNILWIEWKDGVAYRKALGRVLKPAWEQLELKIIDVTLC